MSDKAPTIWRPSRLSTSTAILVSLVSSLAYATFLLAGNFRTTFGPIDDHEPLSWLDGANALPLSQFFHVLLDRTEIGNFGETVRFRPAYYFVRVGQAILFGDNPTHWYLLAFLIFAATIALLGILAWIWVSLGIGGNRPSLELFFAAAIPVAGVIMFGSLRAWMGIVARLGPSELLAMFGVALILVGSTLLVVKPSPWWWLPALAGTLLAIGSKENFLPIVLVPMCVGLFRFARMRHAVSLIPVFASLFVGIIITFGVSATAGPNGTDVYGRSVGMARAVDALTELFGTYAVFWIPGALLLLGSLLLWLLVRPRPPRDLQALIVLGSAGAFLWLLFDAWTYRGIYEMVRYWMVSDFLKVLGIVGTVALSVGVLSSRQGLIARGLALIALIAAFTLAALQVAAAPQSASSIRAEVRANALAASIWNDGVASALREIRTLDRPQVVVVPRGSIDFEPVIALTRALSASVDDLSVFVLVEPTAAATPEGGPAIEILQRVGWEDPTIEPLSALDESGEILCIFLNAEPRETAPCSPDSSARVQARGI